ncbi:hypothetical protein KW111_27455, partial [Klebsiella pneumoniae]|nr:hypothetical protein [Klebsiella pneumoniae]
MDTTDRQELKSWELVETGEVEGVTLNKRERACSIALRSLASSLGNYDVAEGTKMLYLLYCVVSVVLISHSLMLLEEQSQLSFEARSKIVLPAVNHLLS